MAGLSYKSIRASVGRKATNSRNDVKMVQQLINGNIWQLIPLRELKVDGVNGPRTIGAIEYFQSRVLGFSRPDGRVDPKGKTIAALNRGTQSSDNLWFFDRPVGTPGQLTVTFKHGNIAPRDLEGDLTDTSGAAGGLYESKVIVAGKGRHVFRGSIYPDNINQRGRLRDGKYDLNIGFHKRRGHVPTAADLVARKNGFRAALIVNADKTVPVISNKASKTKSSYIHVHNGFNSARYSLGCCTIHPSDWANFIKFFLNTYPDLATWQATNRYVGQKIGKLVITA